MFTVLIVMWVIIAILTLVAIVSQSEETGVAAVIVFALTLIPFLTAMRFQIGSQNLTGFIYQRSEKFGYVSYDLRYSQNAGQDSQPSFCVKAGSDEDKKLQVLVGEETKVSINIPAAAFRLTNDLWECSSFATLEKTLDSRTEPLQ